MKLTASWWSGNAFVSGAGDLRFKSQAGQIEHSVASSSPLLQHFLEKSCVARMGPQTHYMLRHNTVSIKFT